MSSRIYLILIILTSVPYKQAEKKGIRHTWTSKTLWWYTMQFILNKNHVAAATWTHHTMCHVPYHVALCMVFFVVTEHATCHIPHVVMGKEEFFWWHGEAHSHIVLCHIKKITWRAPCSYSSATPNQFRVEERHAANVGHGAPPHIMFTRMLAWIDPLSYEATDDFYYSRQALKSDCDCVPES